MSVAEQIYALYHLSGDPIAVAATFLTTTGIPDSTWDSADTAGTGKSFGIGFFVQNDSDGSLYRCLDATPGAAVWRLVIQEDL
jgi:hypothetical protein